MEKMSEAVAEANCWLPSRFSLCVFVNRRRRDVRRIEIGG